MNIMGLKKVKLHMILPCISKEFVIGNFPGKKSSDSEEETRRIRNILRCYCGEYKPLKFIKVISKVYVHSFFEIFFSSNLFVRRK